MPFPGETWEAIRKLDLSGRLNAINDEQTAAKLTEEGKSAEFRFDLKLVFSLGGGTTPDYTLPAEKNVHALGKAAGEHFVETFLRLSRESNGKVLFNLRMFNQSLTELGELIQNKNIFPSLGDAGAHVSQIMDAGWCSFVLSYWMREKGLYTLGEGIRRLTSGPARVLGLSDRGTIKESLDVAI